MKKNSLKISWVDDDGRRITYANAINMHSYKHPSDGKRYSAEVNFILVNRKDPLNLATLKNIHGSDVIIVDHFLTGSVGSSKSGSTVAGMIRELLKGRCAIIGVSAGLNEKRINPELLVGYDEILQIGSISKRSDLIFSIAVEYKKLVNIRQWTNSKVLAQFRCPDVDSPTLAEIIPKVNDRQQISIRELYSWTKHTFMENPGLLLNREWVANLIGVKPPAFSKLESIFKSAEYKGLFSVPSETRWWRSEVKRILYDRVNDTTILNPWVAGHKLPQIKEADHSRCGHCKEKYPEILGYRDDSGSSFIPLHYKCSVPYEGRRKELYFEELRKMRD